jgi:predicted component of type VI protein secretion system
MKMHELVVERLRNLEKKSYFSVTVRATALAAILPVRRNILEFLNTFGIDTSHGLANYYSKCQHLESLIAELVELSEDADEATESKLYLRT